MENRSSPTNCLFILDKPDSNRFIPVAGYFSIYLMQLTHLNNTSLIIKTIHCSRVIFFVSVLFCINLFQLPGKVFKSQRHIITGIIGIALYKYIAVVFCLS